MRIGKDYGGLCEGASPKIMPAFLIPRVAVTQRERFWTVTPDVVSASLTRHLIWRV